MQIVWNVWNHNPTGIRSLEDIIEIISSQLVALGHKPAWDRNNEQMVSRENGINILVEGFTKNHIEIISKMHQAGARFIILATEEPTEKGFNHGTQEEMVRRQEVFPLVAPFIEGIIHLVPGDHVTKWYSQFAPSTYTELGYAPQLLRMNAPIVVTLPNGMKQMLPGPDYDFGFYGSYTKRRERILKKLANLCRKDKAIKLMVDFGPRADRDNEMRRAKVIVQVRKFDEMGLVSSSRCNTALCIGRPVIAEPHDLATPWDQVVRFAKTEQSFFDEAMYVLSLWKHVHVAQLAKFKEKFPPEACIGKALDELGILREPARMAS